MKNLAEALAKFIANHVGWRVRYHVWMGYHGSCDECGRPYGNEYGFPDMVVPDDVWKQISDGRDEGGLLCPSCICFRAQRLNIESTARFMSGPFSPREVSE